MCLFEGVLKGNQRTGSEQLKAMFWDGAAGSRVAGCCGAEEILLWESFTFLDDIPREDKNEGFHLDPGSTPPSGLIGFSFFET